ncbi:MAG: hypothetical protein WCH11_04875 [Bdellovibrio sp.]
MNRKILHILISYKTSSQAEKFLLDCIRQKASSEVEFILVNNSARSPEDLTFQHLENAQVRVLSCPDNPGYFPASERALKMVGDIRAFHWVIVSNADLKWDQQDAYSELLKTSVMPGQGVFGPRIHSELFRRETNPLSWHRPTPKKIEFLSLVYSSYILAFSYHFLSSLKNYFFSPEDQELSKPMDQRVIYSLHGAFLIFHRNFFVAGGSLHHPVALYGEEYNIAEQCLALRIRPLLLPQLRLSHQEAGSQNFIWQRLGLSGAKFRQKQQSLVFLRQLYGLSPK